MVSEILCSLCFGKKWKKVAPASEGLKYKHDFHDISPVVGAEGDLEQLEDYIFAFPFMMGKSSFWTGTQSGAIVVMRGITLDQSLAGGEFKW